MLISRLCVVADSDRASGPVPRRRSIRIFRRRRRSAPATKPTRPATSTTALEALNYAAANGHPGALWKLGRMYQTGDLVAEDDGKAMELFARVADEYGDENPRRA